MVLFFELAHELHVLERVDLKLCELVVEASLTDLDGLSDVRLKRKLLAWSLSIHVTALSKPKKVAMA